MSAQQIIDFIEHKYPQRDVLYVVDKVLNLQLPNMLALAVSEEIKTLATVQQIWDFLLAHHATRRSLLVCIGGGVITDLGGFAAATYRRGIDYVNIPTTLLAMVDAATGGKTGCNYHGLKNAIGVIREPLETIIRSEWLHTLPQQEILNGYSELIKTALITDAEEYIRLLQLLDNDDLHLSRLLSHIDRAVVAKQRIVAQDPNEQGLRKVLNFGHTIGHALEELRPPSTDGIRGIPHGYAVMYGMVAELYLSVVLLGLDKQVLQQISHLMVQHYGRPVCSCADYGELIALMREDKKNERAGEINFTLLKRVGEPVTNQVVEEPLIREALEYLFTL